LFLVSLLLALEVKLNTLSFHIPHSSYQPVNNKSKRALINEQEKFNE